MKKRPGHDSSSYLSDLAFLLIIFFVLLAGSTTIRQIPASVQQQSSVQPIVSQAQAKTLVISIGPDGLYDYDGKAYQASYQLETDIKALDIPLGSVYLKISSLAPWKQVTPILSLCDQLQLPVYMEEQP